MAFNLGNLMINLAVNSAKMDRGLSKAQGKIKKFENDLGNIGQGMKSLGFQASAFVTLPLAGLTTFALKASAEMESLQVSLGAMLKDEQKAIELMDDIKSFSAGTPFQIQDIGQSAKILLAFGREQSQVMEDMKRLGDIAAGTNTPLNEMAKIFGKVIAKGRAQTEELNQLGERGLPILQELQKMYGKTAVEIRKMAEDGELTADVIEEAFRRMTEDGGMFEDLMEKQSKTLNGVWSNLKDNIFLAAVEMGDFISEAIDLKGIANGVIERIQGIVKWFKGLSNQTRKTILILIGIAAAIGPVLMIVGTLILAFKALIGVLVAVKAAFAALLFNPIVLGIAAVIAILAALVVMWIQVQGKGETFFEKMESLMGKDILNWQHWVETISSFFLILASNAMKLWANIKAGFQQFMNDLETAAFLVMAGFAGEGSGDAFADQLIELSNKGKEIEAKRKKAIQEAEDLLKINLEPPEIKKKQAQVDKEAKKVVEPFMDVVKKFAGIAEISGLEGFRARNNLVPDEPENVKNRKANEETAKNTNELVEIADKTNKLLEKMDNPTPAGIQ